MQLLIHTDAVVTVYSRIRLQRLYFPHPNICNIVQDVLLFIPNIVGYIRLSLLATATLLGQRHASLIFGLLVTNFALDAVDGILARALHQVSPAVHPPVHPYVYCSAYSVHQSKDCFTAFPYQSHDTGMLVLVTASPDCRSPHLALG